MTPPRAAQSSVSGPPDAGHRIWRRLAEEAPCAIQLFDAAGRWRWSNAAARAHRGLEPEDLSDYSILEDPKLHSGIRAALCGAFPQAPSVLKPSLDDTEDLRPLGGLVPRPVPLYLDDGTFEGVAVVWTRGEIDFEDSSTEIRFQLSQFVALDPLTGLHNRDALQQGLERELHRLRQVPADLTLLLVDLDHFWEICSTHGHKVGDEVLVEIGKLIRRQVRRTTDIVARIGGDEFALLLPDTSVAGGYHMGRRFLANLITQPVQLSNGSELRITASVGLAGAPVHATTPEELLAAAETAMYEAKRRGRNRLITFHSDFARSDEASRFTEARGRILPELLDGTAEFLPYFQPILDLRTGRIAAHEALARCRTPTGVQSAGEFIVSAEHFGLISSIDRTMLIKSLDALREARRTGETDGSVTVNLSALDLEHDAFLNDVEKMFQDSGLEPGALILEITETAAIRDLALARDFVDRLRGCGIRFALDDFGAGYSSLPALKSLALDWVKLDMSFTRNLRTSPADRQLVKALGELARGLEIETVAEGVEDAETLDLVRELGIDYAQGYHIARPQPNWVARL